MKKTLLTAFIFLSTATIVYAAPSYTFTRTMLPEITDTFDIGTSTKEYRNIYSGTSTSALFIATSTTATSTFAGNVDIAGNLKVGGTASLAVSPSLTGFTTGSALFVGAGSTIAQDNANFFWDDTSNQLRIADGTVNVPSITFASNTMAGFMYNLAQNGIGVVIDGVSETFIRSGIGMYARGYGITNVSDPIAGGMRLSKVYINGTDGRIRIGDTAAPTEVLELFNSGVSTTLGQLSNNLRLENTQNSVADAGSEISFKGMGTALNTAIYGAISAPILAAGTSGTLGYISFSTKALQADTALTERMRIDYTGNVGIGITNPQNLLVVNTTVSNTPAKIELNGGQPTSVGNTTAEFLLGMNEGGVSRNGVGLRAVRSTVSGTDATDFAIAVAGTEWLRIDKTGKVGVRTSAPNANFEVAGVSADTDFRISRTVSPTTYFSITAPGGSPARSILGVNGANVLTVQDNIQVGIGNTSPAYRLDIATAVSNDRGINIENSGTGSAQYGIVSQSIGAATTNIGGYFSATGAGTNYGLLVANGKTGIGLTAPAYSLAVKGILDVANAVGDDATGQGKGITIGSAVSDASNFINSGQGGGWELHFATGNAGTYNASFNRMTISDSTVKILNSAEVVGNTVFDDYIAGSNANGFLAMYGDSAASLGMTLYDTGSVNIGGTLAVGVAPSANIAGLFRGTYTGDGSSGVKTSTSLTASGNNQNFYGFAAVDNIAAGAFTGFVYNGFAITNPAIISGTPAYIRGISINALNRGSVENSAIYMEGSSGSGANYGLNIASAPSGGTTNIGIYNAGTSYLAGNVGIGQNATSNALDVVGTGMFSTSILAPYTSYGSSGANKTNITFTSNGSQYGTIQTENIGGGGAWSLGYQSSPGSTIGTNVLTWNGTGQVGVGTTTPYATLSVQSNSSTGDAFVLATSTTGNLFKVSNTATSTFYGSISVPSTGLAPIVGNATLGVGGTVTVNTRAATANSYVMLTRKTSGGTIGTAITYTVTGGSFTITSDNILDTSTFTWLLMNP